MDWQPIETVPDEDEVLLFFPARKATREWGRGAPARMAVGRYFEHNYGVRVPTRWMPLPEPPNDA